MIEAITTGLIQETQCLWFEPKRLRQMLLSVDGAGSGLDADKLDGYEATAFPRLAANNTFTTSQNISGSNEALRIIGNGTSGDASIGYISFYDSNGTTRRGYIGDAAGIDDNIYVRAETGDLYLGDSSASDAVILSGGVFSVGADTDIINTFGKVKIGYNTVADSATFSHYDHMNSSDYCLRQAAAGATVLNAVATKSIRFRIGNIGNGYFDAIGLKIGAESAPADALDVTGNGRFSGTIRTALGTTWDMGGYTAGAPAATGYVTVKVAGTTYKLLTST